MLGVYSKPASGYMTLHPVKDMGEDLTVALYKAGVRSDTVLTARAEGFAMVSRGRPVVLHAYSQQAARQAAIAAVPDGPVILVKAVARGRSTVFRRVEVLEALSPAVAAKQHDLDLVAFNGALIEKATNPFDPVDQRVIANRLASQLGYNERKVIGPQIEEWLNEFDYDYANLKPQQFNQVLKTFRTRVHKALNKATDHVMPLHKQDISFTAQSVIKGAKRSMKASYLPTIGLALSQPETAAIASITDMGGWFIRDATGYRADTLTRSGRIIVQEGLQKGLGRDAIAKNLQKGLPQAYAKQGLNYFRTLAASSVSRARSFTEVNSYVEAGIEQLEIQAVLDERTTEICRCLDGQVISTNLAHQQVLNTMNLKNPEDIYQESPFLKEVYDSNSGVKSIVSTSTGQPIANVVRSGMGVAGDRGQFASFRMGNQLTDANLGPPPYHHLCRSWTIPVTTTVQVPANHTPMAGPLPPTIPGKGPKPPKEPPPRKPPILPPGVVKPPAAPKPPAPRPITTVPQPRPGQPTVHGEGAIIDNYAFPDDFIHAVDPRAPFARVGAKSPTAMSYQTYSYDTRLGGIRANSKWTKIRRPAGTIRQQTRDRTVYDNVRKDLTVFTDDVGVAVEVSAVNMEALESIILNEGFGGIGGVRGYSVHGAMTNRYHYLRFDHNKRRAAKKYLQELNRAKNTAQRATAIAKIEQTGFLKQSTKPDIFFGGTSPQPKVPPKPKPRPKPKPKPKPQPQPRVRPKPKPKPTVAEPKVPGQPVTPRPKPKPKKPKKVSLKPVKDYSKYGLVNGEPLSAQVRRRIEIETPKLQKVIAEVEAQPGYDKLTITQKRKLKGKALKQYFKEQIKPDTSGLTREVIEDKMEMSFASTREVGRKEAFKEYRRSHPQSRRKNVKLSEFKTLQGDEMVETWRTGMELTSARVQAAATARQKMPTIYTRNVRTSMGRNHAYQSTEESTIQIVGKTQKERDWLIKHEMSHWLDTLGKNEQATRIARRGWTKSDKVYNEGYRYLKGKWGDKYCGRVYSYDGTEINSVMAESFADKNAAKLGKMWDSNPEHVGFYLAYLQGAFI